MSDLPIENQTCPTVAYQMSSVCVPVTVTPFAKAGLTVTKCCSKPTVQNQFGQKNRPTLYASVCSFAVNFMP